MSLEVTGDNKPTLTLKTNLPPKSIVMVSLTNPISLGGDGYAGQQSEQVGSDHTIRSGPFSRDGKELSPGNYQVTVGTVIASLQPQEVLNFFGTHGEKLTGPQILVLPGTSERYFKANFHFTVGADVTQNKLGGSQQNTIGSTTDKWQKVPGVTPEIFIMTNGRYFKTNPPLGTAEQHFGFGFVTNIVANLPKSIDVGAPQSVMVQLEGNCESQHYSVLGSVSFEGKNRSGVALRNTPAENIEKTLVSGSPLEKAFNMLCVLAMDQK